MLLALNMVSIYVKQNLFCVRHGFISIPIHRWKYCQHSLLQVGMIAETSLIGNFTFFGSMH